LSARRIMLCVQVVAHRRNLIRCTTSHSRTGTTTVICCGKARGGSIAPLGTVFSCTSTVSPMPGRSFEACPRLDDFDPTPTGWCVRPSDARLLFHMHYPALCGVWLFVCIVNKNPKQIRGVSTCPPCTSLRNARLSKFIQSCMVSKNTPVQEEFCAEISHVECV